MNWKKSSISIARKCNDIIHGSMWRHSKHKR